MRVVMIGNSLSLVSGHSRVSWDIAAGLSRQGHEVQIVASHPNPTTLQRSLALVAEANVEPIWREQINFAQGELRANNSALRQRIGQALAKADVAHFFDMRALRAVSGMFGGRIPVRSLLHVSSLPNLRLRDLRDAGWTSLIRAVMHVSDRTSALVPAGIVRRLLGMADMLVCASQFLSDEMARRYKVPSERLSVVHTGVKLQDVSEELPDRPDFVYFGWPGSHRGTLDAAEAMARFGERFGPARCLISTYSNPHRLGEHTLIIRSLRRRFVPRGVQYTDFMPDIRKRLVGARAAVLPFRSPFGYAQIPLVVLESLAAGAPVVSTDVGGVREAIVHGENGLLVGRGDIDALVEAMGRLWQDRDLHDRMSSAARRTIAEKFSLEKTFQDMMRVYQGPAAGRQVS